MLPIPALKGVQQFKRIACMFMFLDLAGRVHFYWLNYQVQTIRTSKMLRINFKSVLFTLIWTFLFCAHVYMILLKCVQLTMHLSSRMHLLTAYSFPRIMHTSGSCFCIHTCFWRDAIKLCASRFIVSMPVCIPVRFPACVLCNNISWTVPGP